MKNIAKFLFAALFVFSMVGTGHAMKEKSCKNKCREKIRKILQDLKKSLNPCSAENLTESFVYVDVLMSDDTSQTGYYLKETLLPANTSLRVVATGEKLIIAPSNKLQVRSSIDDSVDVVASIVEIV